MRLRPQVVPVEEVGARGSRFPWLRQGRSGASRPVRSRPQRCRARPSASPAMATRSCREKAQKQNEQHQAILAKLLREEDNKYCADCEAKGTAGRAAAGRGGAGGPAQVRRSRRGLRVSARPGLPRRVPPRGGGRRGGAPPRSTSAGAAVTGHLRHGARRGAGGGGQIASHFVVSPSRLLHPAVGPLSRSEEPPAGVSCRRRPSAALKFQCRVSLRCIAQSRRGSGPRGGPGAACGVS